MFKPPKLTVTIVILILWNNNEHIGSYATKEVVNLKLNNNGQLHHLAKRMDLEICLGQFDIHKNTIIRTGESQAIGGKYLQGLELDTMEECQRLCCETDLCDVYIFESKKDGYCYLFECGTPENFHCKFTRHANYTSAVLTPVVKQGNEVTTPHPVPQHKAATGITQQEWELSNLKIKTDLRDKEENLIATNTNEGGVVKKVLNVETGLSYQKINATSQCGRFQFACHSGECIAVYNACDGIPQCEDGSDEGPECPGEVENSISALKPASDVGAVVNKQPAMVSSASLSQYQPSLMQQSAQQQLQSMQQHPPSNQMSAQPVPVVHNREDANIWEARKMAAANSLTVSGNNGANAESQQATQGDGFTTFVNSGAVSQGSMYAQGSASDVATGLNSNAGGSTIEQSGLFISHLPAQDANAVYAQQHQQHILLPPPPPPPPAPINSNWQQQAIMQEQKFQRQQLQQQNLQITRTEQQPPPPQQQQQQQQPQHQQKLLSLPEGPFYAMPNGMAMQQQQQQQVINMMPQQQQQQQPVQTLMASSAQHKQPPHLQFPLPIEMKAAAPLQFQASVKNENSEEYEDSDEKSTEPPKKHKHKKVKTKSKDMQKASAQFLGNDADPSLQQLPQATSKNVATSAVNTANFPAHEQYEIIHQNMALEFRDHDGQSERPGGAVLSLTLGLLITATLAILIGCRMRTVGRRARRLGGKTPYSHEADFLVNGMYL